MKDEFVKSIGIWGLGCPADTSAAGRRTDRADRRDQRHYNYLKKHSPTIINVIEGNLEQYLKDIDKDAQDMFEKLVKQMAETEGITEELKATDQMAWVQRMNCIRQQAMEIVSQEFINI